MPLPHSIHLLLNHVSDCMRRARSTAGSSRDARSPLCATGVNEPVVTTVPCCWTLELTAAASAACGPGLVLPICKCVGHFRCSQVPRESRFCQTSRVPCLGPLSDTLGTGSVVVVQAVFAMKDLALTTDSPLVAGVRCARSQCRCRVQTPIAVTGGCFK